MCVCVCVCVCVFCDIACILFSVLFSMLYVCMYVCISMSPKRPSAGDVETALSVYWDTAPLTAYKKDRI